MLNFEIQSWSLYDKVDTHSMGSASHQDSLNWPNNHWAALKSPQDSPGYSHESTQNSCTTKSTRLLWLLEFHGRRWRTGSSEPRLTPFGYWLLYNGLTQVHSCTSSSVIRVHTELQSESELDWVYLLMDIIIRSPVLSRIRGKSIPLDSERLNTSSVPEFYVKIRIRSYFLVVFELHSNGATKVFRVSCPV